MPRAALVVACLVGRVRAYACLNPSGTDASIDVIYRDFNASHRDMDRGVFDWHATTGLVASSLSTSSQPTCISTSGNFTGSAGMLVSCDTINNEWFQDVAGLNVRVERPIVISLASGVWTYTSAKIT